MSKVHKIVCLDLSRFFHTLETTEYPKNPFGLYVINYQQCITTFTIVTGRQRLEDKAGKQAQNTNIKYNKILS